MCHEPDCGVHYAAAYVDDDDGFNMRRQLFSLYANVQRARVWLMLALAEIKVQLFVSHTLAFLQSEPNAGASLYARTQRVHIDSNGTITFIKHAWHRLHRRRCASLQIAHDRGEHRAQTLGAIPQSLRNLCAPMRL